MTRSSKNLFVSKLIATLGRGFLIAGAMVILAPSVQVLGLSAQQKEVIDAGAEYFNVQESAFCSTTNPTVGGLAQGSKLFFIGDSLTYGSTLLGDLLPAAKAAGFSVDTNYTQGGSPVRVKGASVEATSGYATANTIERLKEHEADFATGKVDVFVVALGTNVENDLVSKITAFVSYLRSVNSAAKIVWVNTQYTSDDISRPSTDVNRDILVASQQNNFNVIDISNEVTLKPDAGDGVHYSGSGYKRRVGHIIGQLEQGGGTLGSPLDNINMTVYSPQQGGDEVEGGYESARPGPDGVAEVRTLDDVHKERSDYVTLAGDPSLYNKQYMIPNITYINKAGQSVTLSNVKAYVHDTGSAFLGKPEGRYDIAIGKDYTAQQINSQTFVSSMQLIPYTGDSAEPTKERDLSGCSCSASSPPSGTYTQEENYKYTWGYLTGTKGLSENAAAGLMGNLEAESGINPHNMQNNAPLPDGPEFPTETDASGKTVPAAAIKGKFGYGLAQWTSAGRQQNLIDYAQATNRSTGDLALQLDFLWKELSESYTGVLAKLMEPNVTLDAASDEVLLRFEIPKSVIVGGASRLNEIAKRRVNGAGILQAYSGTSGTGPGTTACGPVGGAIDAGSKDSTGVPCAQGTQDLGDFDAYNNGLNNKVRLKVCNVSGTKVNSQLSISLKKLYEDASSAGIPLTGDAFRSLTDQQAIYYKWCRDAGKSPTPGPYPKATYDEYTKCPGGAPPGFSNHETGFAIDFKCNGAYIPQSYSAASTNPCFIWLLANASKYNLFEWGKGEARTKAGYEAWHWSIDGS